MILKELFCLEEIVRWPLPVLKYTSSRAPRRNLNTNIQSSPATHMSRIHVTITNITFTTSQHRQPYSLSKTPTPRREQDKHCQRYWRHNKRNIQLDTNSVINLSRISLMHHETQLLARGLSFCPRPCYMNGQKSRLI